MQIGFGLAPTLPQPRRAGGAVGIPISIWAQIPLQVVLTGVNTVIPTASAFLGSNRTYKIAGRKRGWSINATTGDLTCDGTLQTAGQSYFVPVEVSNAFGPSKLIRFPVAVASATPTLSNQTATFNGSSLLGAGSEEFKPVDSIGRPVPVTAVSVISGAPAQTVAANGNGAVQFSGLPAAWAGAQLSVTCGAPYAGQTITVTCATSATTIYPANLTQWNAAIALGAATLSGDTIAIRAGAVIDNRAYNSWSGKFVGLTGRLTITAENPTAPLTARAALATIRIGGGGINSQVDIQDLDFFWDTQGAFSPLHSLQNPQDTGYNAVFGQTGFLVTTAANTTDINFRRCRGYTDILPARITGIQPAYAVYGVAAQLGSAITVEDCDFYSVHNGFFIGGNGALTTSTFRRNRVDGFYNDGVDIWPGTANSSSVSTVLIEANIFLNPFGRNLLHQDLLHIAKQGGGTGIIVDAVTFRANLFLPAYEGPRSPAGSKNTSGTNHARGVSSDFQSPSIGAVVEGGTLTSQYQTGTFPVGELWHNWFIWMDATSGTDCIIDLTDPSVAVNATSEMYVQAYFGGGGRRIIRKGAYTLFNVTANANVTATEFDLIHPWETWYLRLNRTLNRWEIELDGPVYQFIFGNAISSGSVDNFKTAFNMGCTDNTGWRQEGPTSSIYSSNNDGIFPTWPGDPYDTGVMNTAGMGKDYTGAGRYMQSSATPTMVIRGAIASSIDLSAAAGTVTSSPLNWLNGQGNMQTNWANFVVQCSPPNPLIQVCCPENEHEAAAWYRPPVGSARATSGMGPGLMPPGLEALDYVNFGQHSGTRGFRSMTPWVPLGTTFLPIPGGFHITWNDPWSQHAGGITGTKIAVSKNGGAEVVTTLGAGTLIYTESTGLTADFYDVGMLSTDANGDGTRLTFPRVTLAAGVAPVIPTLTLLGSPAYGGATIVAGATTSVGALSASQANPLFITLVIRKASASNGDIILGSVAFGGVPLIAGPLRKGGLNNSIEIYAFYLPTASVPAGPSALSFVPTNLNVTGWSSRIEEVVNGRASGTIFGNSIGSSATTGTTGGAALTNSALNSVMACTLAKNGTSAITLGAGTPRTTNPVGTIAAHYFSHAQTDMAAIAQQSINGTWTSDQSAALAVEILGATS